MLASGAAWVGLAQNPREKLPPVGDNQLYELIASDWNIQKEHSPALAQFSGDRLRMNAWPDLSEPQLARLAKEDRERLRSLRSISRAKLSHTAQLDYALFERALLNRLQEFRVNAHLTPFWQFERLGPSALRLMPYVDSAMPPATIDELRGRVQRLRGFPKYASQEIERLRRSRRQGMMPSVSLVKSALTDIDAEVAAEPSESAFYRSLAAALPRLPGTEASALLETARSAISEQVRPALEKLRAFLSQEYLPHCPESPSLAGWRNGTELYRFLVRLSTTSNATVELLHTQGLSEVRRIREEMEAAMRAAGFSGSIRDFASTIRSDPRFHCRSEEELVAAYRSTIERIAPSLPKLFERVPASDLSLEPRKFGSGGPGSVYAPAAADGSRGARVLINVSNLDLRPKFEMTALMLHEALPGHHLQKTLDIERGRGSPAGPAIQWLRRSDAFSEGWALYAESLGHEMGLYSDPYARFGALSQEMVRAVRLVIDTGIHARRWSREEAVRYFMEQTGKPAAIAEGEVLRAVWDPGSLAAYKAGELAFKEMRSRASAALGKAFDVREFHGFVLREGSLPVDVLQAEFDKWLRKSPRGRERSVRANRNTYATALRPTLSISPVLTMPSRTSNTPGNSLSHPAFAAGTYCRELHSIAATVGMCAASPAE